MDNNLKKKVLVIGSGPGGYAAAFRAADLGLDVTLIDKDTNLGGVCLNRGCIPSKAFLHIAHLIEETKNISDKGIKFNKPSIDIEKINNWKDDIVSKLTSGIKSLSTQRNVKLVNGNASFLSANRILITNENKIDEINFDFCIIATGSSPSKLNNINLDHEFIIDSTDALSPTKKINELLIVGGGYIGLELGSVYHSLESKVTVAEYASKLLPMADEDLVKPLYDKLSKQFKNIHLSTEVQNLEVINDKVLATFQKDNKIFKEEFDKVLVSTGRTPNTKSLHLEKAGVKLDKNGFIKVNSKLRTIIPNIYAIGDVVGNPMLAHKATHEGKCAAENIAGKNCIFEPLTIPSVIYTNPEIAWAGQTEQELKDNKIKYNKAIFPWMASGRAMTTDATNGKTKILSDEFNSKILGVGIVGANAGELISEAVLAIEMGANIEDLSLTIHPHPTLSETIANSSEILNKTITDLYIK